MTTVVTVPASALRLELDIHATIGECPLWSVAEECLYFVDIAQFKIYRFSPESQALQTWNAPEEPGCLALMTSCRLMVALRSGFAVLDTHTGQWGQTLRVAHDTTQFRFNDGRLDSAGRLWAGTMFAPRTSNEAALYVLERGQVRRVLGPEHGRGVKVSNGLAFDDARGWMYHSDTPNHIVWRYAYDVLRGEVGAAEVFARMNDDRNASDYGGRPDGAALDSEGYYWSAQFEGGRILRFRPDGEVDTVVHVPAKRPTMLAFGGPDLRTLYITSASENASDEELQAYPHTGGLFSLYLPDVGLNAQGVAEPFYQE